MTPLAPPAFDLVALVFSTAIFLLAVGLVHARVAQALERPYRLRQPAGQARSTLHARPRTAPAARAARPQSSCTVRKCEQPHGSEATSASVTRRETRGERVRVAASAGIIGRGRSA